MLGAQGDADIGHHGPLAAQKLFLNHKRALEKPTAAEQRR